ncbi:MAG TPA: AAA family ATPase [Gemmatimonadaceae bacterium]|jgi:DNA-binding SARP family transcriptional activator/tetratricopeptide (TPR) repeat protein
MTPEANVADARPETGGIVPIQLSVLGTAEIRIARAVLTPSAARRFALMLYMLNEGQRAVPRAKLIELLLHDQLSRKANHSLRETVYQLRQLGVPLVSGPTGVKLSDAAIKSDLTDIVAAASLTDEQLETIAAGILPGYAPQLSDAFDDWLGALRERTAFALTKVLVRDLRMAHGNDDWVATERIARVCLRVNPLHEEATLSLAEVLALSGSKAEAVRLLDQYIVEVGGRSTPLALPATLLKRRISERLPQRRGIDATLPFVGRDAEMAILTERLDRARTGESGCVVLLGEAGIGKTRIATEFVARSALKGVRFVTATAQPHDIHRPMGAFVDAVPQLLDLPGALGCSPTSMAALKRLTVHDPAVHQDAEHPGGSDEVAVSIARAIGDLVDAITSETPLIFWLEDAHWLDAMSLQMAASLVSNRVTRRLLLVLTTRERRPLAGHCGEHARTVTVKPLALEASHTIVAKALPSRRAETDASNVEWLVSTAAGNPFFLVSLLNHFDRTGERHSIPSTISELLDERIAALSAQALSILETCVMLGKYATLERIVSAMELPHFQLLLLLRELEDRRMIVKNNDVVQAAHWLIADRVQRASSSITTQLSHRRVAELLEEEARETHSPALLWDCGEHWLGSGDVPKAVQAIRECSQFAVEIGRSREGAELLQRAARLVPAELHVQLIEESIRLANSAAEHDLVLTGTEMLRITGAPLRHDDIEIAELAAESCVCADTDATSERYRRCLDEAGVSQKHREQLALPLIVFCAQHRRHDLAREACDALRPYLIDTDGEWTISGLQFLLIFHSYFGRIEESIRIAREIIARTELPLEQQATLRKQAGVALWRNGEWAEALAILPTAFQLAETCGLVRLRAMLALMLANFYTDMGDRETANIWLSRAEQLLEANPALRGNFEYLMLRTDIASATCNLEELRALYDAGRAIGITSSNERIRSWAFTLNALIEHLSGSATNPIATIEKLTQYRREDENSDKGDFEVATALKMSRSCERPEITRRRLRKYLERDRKSSTPLTAMLQQVASEINQRKRR